MVFQKRKSSKMGADKFGKWKKQLRRISERRRRFKKFRKEEAKLKQSKESNIPIYYEIEVFK